MINQKEALTLLKCGFSILTVGTGKIPNTPWKKYQTKAPSENELIKNISIPSSHNIGIITGYDNLEVIDVDLKVLPESERADFWELLLNNINENLPEIMDKLVIYKTKNNGYHILYKADNLEGNKKLAKSKHSIEAVIETRGIGGYVFVYYDKAEHNSYCDVEKITNDERDIIINVCRSLTYIDIEKHIEQNNTSSNENDNVNNKTFKDFNNRVDIFSLISTEFKIVKQKNNIRTILRNGAKSKSSGYILDDINCMYLFSTGTQYDHEKIYSASDIYIKNNHNGNTWDAFIDLNQQGYGKKIDDIKKFELNIKNKNSTYSKSYSKNEINISIENVKPEPIDFPTHVFPPQIYNFIDDININAGFSKDFLSVSVLSTFASIIGKGVSLKVNGTWVTTPIFWFAVVGDPGSKKSHPVKFSLKPLKEIDIENYSVYKQSMEQYDIYTEMEDKDKKQWIKENGILKKPTYKQLVVRDATIESLFQVHDINERGILLYKDELIGWIKSMGQYKSGKGDEMEKWLSMFDGDELKINRVTKEPLVMESTNVNLIGTIQPDIIAQIPKDNGLLHRFLFTNTDSKIKRFVSNNVNESYISDYIHAVKELDRFFSRSPEQFMYYMDAGAMRKFIEIDDFLCKIQEADDTEPILVQYCEKLKTYTPRFALLLYIINSMYEDNPSDEIDIKNMELAFDLVKYFLNTAKIMFLETRENREAKESKHSLNGKSTIDKILSMVKDKIPKTKIAKELDVSRSYIYKVIEASKK